MPQAAERTIAGVAGGDQEPAAVTGPEFNRIYRGRAFPRRIGSRCRVMHGQRRGKGRTVIEFEDGLRIEVHGKCVAKPGAAPRDSASKGWLSELAEPQAARVAEYARQVAECGMIARWFPRASTRAGDD